MHDVVNCFLSSLGSQVSARLALSARFYLKTNAYDLHEPRINSSLTICIVNILLLGNDAYLVSLCCFPFDLFMLFDLCIYKKICLKNDKFVVDCFEFIWRTFD